MPPKPCLDCGRLSAASRCPEHAAQREQERNASRPWYGTEWRRLRAEQLRRQPFCSVCGGTADLTVDHVIPRSLAGGLQTLCRPHNAAKGGRA